MNSTAKTILIVEDDMLIIEMVSLKLSDNGYVPQFVMSGDETVEAALKHSPELIILDIMLPQQNGEEVLIELKEHPALKDIPVIIFTNKSLDENRERMLELGACEYLVKATTDLTALLSRIDEHLRNTTEKSAA